MRPESLSPIYTVRRCIVSTFPNAQRGHACLPTRTRLGEVGSNLRYPATKHRSKGCKHADANHSQLAVASQAAMPGGLRFS